MKIISWNCYGATDKKGFSKEKINYITKFEADIYIIQECKDDDINNLNKKYKKSCCDKVYSDYGIGIFSDIYNITKQPEHNRNFRYLVPFKISKNKFEFTLFVVWSKNRDKNSCKAGYHFIS